LTDVDRSRNYPCVGGFSAEAVRHEFPAMTRLCHGAPLVYLDTASTAQKPRAVLEASARAQEVTANIHRGVHQLSVEATAAFEATRTSAARLLGGVRPEEIVFVRGTTEGMNLVAQTLGRARVSRGDEVLVTELEHHSNLVPWQMLCAEKGARLRALRLDDRGDIILEPLSERTRIVAVSHASNSLGTVLPVRAIADRANAVGATVVVDGAQGVVHGPVDVRALGCDVYVFSGHKLYGPTGTGVVWGRYDLLASLPPWHGGGDMVEEVSLEQATYRPPPHRFEAGTPNIAGIIGLGAAIEWFLALGPERVAAHDRALVTYALDALAEIPDLRFVGAPRARIGVISFLLGDHHPHDVGTACDAEGVAIRTGHHCAQPVMNRFDVAATARASFGVYNTFDDVDRLVAALRKARDILGARA
jgi:cysteine desulfurase/selenocysteine lyase